MCWYSESRKTIETIFGNDADLFCDLLAATSPRKQVRANWNLARRIYDAHKANLPIPTTGLMPTNFNNVRRALAGQELSGPKVAAFAANLKGDHNRVTIDVWILRHFKIGKKISAKQYVELEKKIQRLARRHKMTPAAYQAKIWCESMRRVGRKPISYTSVSDINQLKFAFVEN